MQNQHGVERTYSGSGTVSAHGVACANLVNGPLADPISGPSGTLPPPPHPDGWVPIDAFDVQGSRLRELSARTLSLGGDGLSVGGTIIGAEFFQLSGGALPAGGGGSAEISPSEPVGPQSRAEITSSGSEPTFARVVVDAEFDLAAPNPGEPGNPSVFIAAYRQLRRMGTWLGNASALSSATATRTRAKAEIHSPGEQGPARSEAEAGVAK